MVLVWHLFRMVKVVAEEGTDQADGLLLFLFEVLTQVDVGETN